MRRSSSHDVKNFLLRHIEEQLAFNGYPTDDICDDFDLLTRGVIDSLGFLEMTVALQEEFDIEFDFDKIDPEQLSIVGPLCQYVSCNNNPPLEESKVVNFSDLPGSEQYVPEVLAGIHDAGNPFYDWFFGGHDLARRTLGKRLYQSSSEISLNRIKVHFYNNQHVGGSLGLSGQELHACCKADMSSLISEMRPDNNFGLSERFTAMRKLLTRVKPDAYFLSKMWINPKYRDNRMDHEILQGCLKTGWEAGFKTFQLNVSADNQPAVNLYNTYGFQVTEKFSFHKFGLEYLYMQLEQ